MEYHMGHVTLASLVILCSVRRTFCTPPVHRLHFQRSSHHCDVCRLSLKPGSELPHPNVGNFRFTDVSVQQWLSDQPYMRNTLGCGDRWFKGGVTYPSDARLLSFGAMGGWADYEVGGVVETPTECLKTLSERCRMRSAYRLLLNITGRGREAAGDGGGVESMCHFSFNRRYNLVTTVCCSNKHGCRTQPPKVDSVYRMLWLLDVLALLITLVSPLVILKLKIWLQHTSTVKFFRASLKTGITGQRNYVIRISERQLINLKDKHPFSLVRFLCRLIVHWQGEGRCCIHMWHEWYDQPPTCERTSCYYKCCWPSLIRVALIFGPLSALYSLVNYAIYSHHQMTIYRNAMIVSEGRATFDLNRAVVIVYPGYWPYYSLFLGYGAVSFCYASALVMWPSNTLEACLGGWRGEQEQEHQHQANVTSETTAYRNATSSQRTHPSRHLYSRLVNRYKNAWYRLHYGTEAQPVSVFSVGLGMKIVRVSRLFYDTLTLLPLVSVMVELLNFDRKLYNIIGRDKSNATRDQDAYSLDNRKPPDVEEKSRSVKVFQIIVTTVIWFGFLSLTIGAAAFLFVATQLFLNILFFFLIGIFTQSTYLQTYVLIIIAGVYYLNRELTSINRTMAYILRLIDEYSPRVTATCDQPEIAFSDRSVQILKAHNLGAVKFIDSDDRQFVSKQLYYAVADSLGVTWSYILRRLLAYSACAFIYSVLVHCCVDAVRGTGSGGVTAATPLFFGALALLALPRVICRASAWRKSQRRPEAWSSRMADILDGHVRVDRDGEAVVERERELTTYDVRPVGGTEYERPTIQECNWAAAGSRGESEVRMWTFSPAVSVQRVYASSGSAGAVVGAGDACAEFRKPQSPLSIAIATKIAAGYFAVRAARGCRSRDNVPAWGFVDTSKPPQPPTSGKRVSDETDIATLTELVEGAVLEGVARSKEYEDPPRDPSAWFPTLDNGVVGAVGVARVLEGVGDTMVSLTDCVYAAIIEAPSEISLLVTVGNASIAVVCYVAEHSSPRADDARLSDVPADRVDDNDAIMEEVVDTTTLPCRTLDVGNSRTFLRQLPREPAARRLLVFSGSSGGDVSIVNIHGARLIRADLDTPTLQRAMQTLLVLRKVSVAACLDNVTAVAYDSQVPTHTSSDSDSLEKYVHVDYILT